MPTVGDLLAAVRGIDPSWTLDRNCDHRLCLVDGAGRVRHLAVTGGEPPRVQGEWVDPDLIPRGEACVGDGRRCPFLRDAGRGEHRCSFLDDAIHYTDLKTCGRNMPDDEEDA